MVWLLTSIALADGSIFVQTGPGQTGRIFVDGADSGVDAPGTVTVPAGNHLIQVKGDCLSGVGSADVSDGKVARLEVDMQPIGGFAEIRATPKGALATLDGVSTPLPAAVELTCGPHELVVTAAGYNTHSDTLRVEMGGAYRVEVALTQLGFGSLSVLVDPVDAEVLVDGEVVATGPITIDSLAEGEHLVTVRKDGLGEQTRTVKVISGETAQLQMSVGNAISTAKPPKEPRQPKDLSGLGPKIAGGALVAAGVGAAGYGSYKRYQGYEIHVNADQDRDGVIDDGKTDYYNENKAAITSARRTSWIMWAGGAAALGTGAALLVDEQGAMVTATVRF